MCPLYSLKWQYLLHIFFLDHILFSFYIFFLSDLIHFGLSLVFLPYVIFYWVLLSPKPKSLSPKPINRPKNEQHHQQQKSVYKPLLCHPPTLLSLLSHNSWKLSIDAPPCPHFPFPLSSFYRSGFCTHRFTMTALENAVGNLHIAKPSGHLVTFSLTS